MRLSSPINSTKIHKIRLFIASPSKFIIKLKANSAFALTKWLVMLICLVDLFSLCHTIIFSCHTDTLCHTNFFVVILSEAKYPQNQSVF